MIFFSYYLLLYCSLFFYVEQIGHLPKGLNPPSLNMLYLSGPHLAVAIKTGIVTGILSLTVSCPIQAFHFF